MRIAGKIGAISFTAGISQRLVGRASRTIKYWPVINTDRYVMVGEYSGTHAAAENDLRAFLSALGAVIESDSEVG